MFQLIVKDEDGKVVGTTTVTDKGNPPNPKDITVDGLTPYKNYTTELVVHNEEFSSSIGPIEKSTSATSNVLALLCHQILV